MERSELLLYELNSVRMVYTTDVGEHTRTGIIYSVTQTKVVFWPFEQDNELMIELKDIKDVDKLKT